MNYEYIDMFINPNNPVYNTLIFYILITCIVLIVKPDFMYCTETGKFRPFGCDKGQTIWSFPVVSIGSVIVLYVFFLGVEIFHNYMSE